MYSASKHSFLFSWYYEVDGDFFARTLYSFSFFCSEVFTFSQKCFRFLLFDPFLLLIVSYKSNTTFLFQSSTWSMLCANSPVSTHLSSSGADKTRIRRCYPEPDRWSEKGAPGCSAPAHNSTEVTWSEKGATGCSAPGHNSTKVRWSSKYCSTSQIVLHLSTREQNNHWSGRDTRSVCQWTQGLYKV